MDKSEQQNVVTFQLYLSEFDNASLFLRWRDKKNTYVIFLTGDPMNHVSTLNTTEQSNP